MANVVSTPLESEVFEVDDTRLVDKHGIAESVDKPLSPEATAGIEEVGRRAVQKRLKGARSRRAEPMAPRTLTIHDGPAIEPFGSCTRRPSAEGQHHTYDWGHE